MSFKRQRTQSKTAKCLLEYDDKYYVAINKKGLLSAIGGKGERCDRSAWDCLLRELKEETGVTIVTKVNGPIHERGINYFHVKANKLPQTQSADVKIVALNLSELNRLSDKEKCYTLKRVEALFAPFQFIGYESICSEKKAISPERIKEIQMILDTPTEEFKMKETRSEEVYKILLGCGDPFLDKPRRDPTCPTARQQLQGIMTQPLKISVNYKRKEFKGKSYGRRYAETEFYPPIQSMEKNVRACMSIGKLPIRPIDVDMSRAHPCFVVDLLGDLCPPSFFKYVTEREDILKDCMLATGLSREEVKPLYNVPFFADDTWKLQYWEK